MAKDNTKKLIENSIINSEQQKTKKKTKPKNKKKTTRATKPKTTRATKPKTTRATKPKTTRATKPKTTRATKPKTTRATKPKTTRATKPKTTRATAPKTTKSTKPKTTKTTKTPEELHKIRSQASKRGWETRRAKQKEALVSRINIERENLYSLIRETAQYADGVNSKIEYLIDTISNLSDELIKGVTERVAEDRYFNVHLRAFLYNDDGAEIAYLQMLLSTIKGTPLSLIDVSGYDTGVEPLFVDTETGEIIT